MAISFSRIEKILENMLGYPVTIEQPNSRIEELLIELGDIIAEGGTKDYDELENKPSINNVTLSGNKTLSDLGITNPLVLKGRVNSVSELPQVAEVGWFYLVGLVTDDNLREYVYTDANRWEFIGFSNIVVDSALSDVSENPVQNKVIKAVFDAIDTLHKSVTLESGDDLNDLYIDQSPTNTDCVTRKWVIPSADVGASLLHLPASFKTVYPNCEIEWHTVKIGGVGYQVLTGGTNSSFQRFIRFRNTSGWTDWVDWQTAVDNALSSTSENPVQNKVITELATPMTQVAYDALVSKPLPLYFIYES